MYNFDEPIQLRKRFRHEEEHQYLHSHVPWNKHIIDLENGTYLGRTPKHWLYLVIFYIIFYTVLIILWAICYVTFRGTVPDKRPKWNLKQPGFSFEPSVNSAEYDFKIEYHQQKEDEVGVYVDRIELGLRKYGAIPSDYFAKCSSENEFGYKQGNPCIFLKINRIVGFKSETIERPYDLPRDAPLDLYLYLKKLSASERKGRLWVFCQSNPYTEMEYFPQRFYNASVVDTAQAITHEPRDVDIEDFGEDNARFYNSLDFQRIIAVRISNVTLNVNYRIVCSLWAKNVQRDVRGKMSRGMVRFNLKIKSERVGTSNKLKDKLYPLSSCENV